MAGIDKVACITVAATDQDEPLHWFAEKLGFIRRVDRAGPGIRFLAVSPENQPEDPPSKPFGLQAVFKDLHGNSYALLEPGRLHERSRCFFGAGESRPA